MFSKIGGERKGRREGCDICIGIGIRRGCVGRKMP
jgi:hypothetical protein